MTLRILLLTLISLASTSCGLKGPLYDPDSPRSADEATVTSGSATSDKDKQRRPAPQSQKENRERADEPAQDTDQPAAPLDPDRPDTATPSGL